MGGDGTGPGTKDEDRNLTSAAQGVVLRHEFAYPTLASVDLLPLNLPSGALL